MIFIGGEGIIVVSGELNDQKYITPLLLSFIIGEGGVSEPD